MRLNYKNNFFYIFILLGIFWVILTQSLSYGKLIIGVICAFVVSLVIYDLFGELTKSQPFSLRILFLFLVYTFKLSTKILKSNFQLMSLVLSPGLPIKPKILEIKPNLKGEFARVVMANSITLLPLTLAVEVTEKGKYYVHCLADQGEKDIKDIEKFVLHIFGEK